jgi:hypothetical protein
MSYTPGTGLGCVRCSDLAAVLNGDMAHSPPCKWGQDVVIVAKLPTCVTQMAIDRLQRFVEPRLIHVVTTSRAKCEVFRGMSSRVRCYAEDEVVEGMTFEGVRA